MFQQDENDSQAGDESGLSTKLFQRRSRLKQSKKDECDAAIRCDTPDDLRNWENRVPEVRRCSSRFGAIRMKTTFNPTAVAATRIMPSQIVNIRLLGSCIGLLFSCRLVGRPLISANPMREIKRPIPFYRLKQKFG